MRRTSAFVPFALAALSLAALAQARADGEPRPLLKRVCYSAAETRDEIKARRLREPFAVLKHAAQHFKAEALSAKLCRIDDEFIYEIALLHRDGKFFHVHVNASTGKIIEFKRATLPTARN
jgi:uncharacterized membrane protein YkoI